MTRHEVKLEDLTLRRNRGKSKLLAYVTPRLQAAKEHYNKHFKDDWRKQRLYWESKFDESLKTRKSERSKLVVPTTQVAVDTASADLDAVVGSLDFYNIEPQVPSDIKEEWDSTYAPLWDEFIENFKENLKDTESRAEISEAIFHSALLDVGYLKAVTEETEVPVLTTDESGVRPDAVYQTRVVNKLVSVDPNKLFFSPGSTGLDDAEFVIEETTVSRSSVLGKIKKMIYEDVPLPKEDVNSGSDLTVYEYHGLIPRGLLNEGLVEAELGDIVFEEDEDDELVEAIVIWMEDTKWPLFRGEMPYLDRRRPYAEFPWDMNPGSRIGKGVAKKIANIQRTEDTSIRARIDALAFSVHPMIGIDGMKLIRKKKMKVYPGKQILTQGRPSDSIEMLRFGDIPQSTFIQSEQLAQMANNATGIQAFSGVDPKFQSGVGLEALSQPTINRNMRTLSLLSDFLKRAVELLLWRSVQFDPDRFPPIVNGFDVSIILGSLTRRFEMSQIANMLKTLPEGSSAYWRLLIKYFELSDLPDKAQVVQDITVLAEAALNPQPPGLSFEQEMLQRQVEWAEKKDVESLSLQRDRVKAELVRAAAALEKIDTEEVRNQSVALLNLAKARSMPDADEETAELLATLERLQEESRGIDRRARERLTSPAGEASGLPGVGGAGNPTEGS